MFLSLYYYILLYNTFLASRFCLFVFLRVGAKYMPKKPNGVAASKRLGNTSVNVNQFVRCREKKDQISWRWS